MSRSAYLIAAFVNQEDESIVLATGQLFRNLYILSVLFSKIAISCDKKWSKELVVLFPAHSRTRSSPIADNGYVFGYGRHERWSIL